MKVLSYIISLIFLWSTGAMAFAPGFLQVAGGGGAVVSNTPDWGGEVVRWDDVNDTSTSVITLPSGVSTGKRIVVFISDNNLTQTISSVADSRGNTYAKDATATPPSSSRSTEIWSAQVTTGISASDTVTITWGSPAYTYRYAMVGYVTNSTGGVDSTGTGGNSYGQSVSITGSTSASDTIIVGCLLSTDSAATYSSSSWDVETAHMTTYRKYYIHKKFTSNGSKDPGGTWDGNVTWGGAWVAYK